jgi:Flp pilus assembly protein TadD
VIVRQAPGTAATAWDRLVPRMARLGQGWAAANRNQAERSLEIYQRILAGDPEDTLAPQGKAAALTALHRPEEAEARELLEQIRGRAP